MDAEAQLIKASREIGSIAGSNGHFTSGLAEHIERTGKSVMDLTVGELIGLSADYRDYYNRFHDLLSKK